MRVGSRGRATALALSWVAVTRRESRARGVPVIPAVSNADIREAKMPEIAEGT